MPSVKLARWLLTIALVAVFAIFGAWKFIQTIIWIGWIPPVFDGLMGLSRELWLNVFGMIEVLLAIGLVVPKRPIQRATALLIVAHLIGVIWVAGFTDVGVRDAGLMLSALALYFLL